MSAFSRHLPFTDLGQVRPRDLAGDLTAALVSTFMAVPQGIAYAVIAGMPPAMGLYAAAIPTIVGSLLRSSRHVITGPTNAVSLLVGGGVALLTGADPLMIGVTLAVMVGVLQTCAGALRLGTVVDYISNPVVLGYITGAGMLIGLGQLPNVTGTPSAQGHLVEKLFLWVQSLGQTSHMAVAMALGTAALILALRKVHRMIPGALIAMAVATALSMVFDLNAAGLAVISDLSPVPAGLSPLTVPDLSLLPTLLPLAVAVTVLSLVESSSVARAIASKTGQRLDTSAEFTGQGIANIVAGFVGAYPTSGSLSRSALNEQTGAKTRLSGVFAGLLMILVLLLFGPVVNHTPIASLAGLLLIVAVDLVDLRKIKLTMKGQFGDKLAFVATMLGTWLLPLDKAIYLGVAISLVLFLRRARLLVIKELAMDEEGRLQEVEGKREHMHFERCDSVHILNVEGRLFFGVTGELQTALDDVIRETEADVIVLRLKRTQGMDVTIASVLESAAKRLQAQKRHLVLAGVRQDTMAILERTGIAQTIGEDKIFTSRDRWFESMRHAIGHACALRPQGRPCEKCPLGRLIDGE